MSTEMAVNAYDIVSTFQAMGMMKYWKGKHIILKRQVSLHYCTKGYTSYYIYILFLMSC